MKVETIKDTIFKKGIKAIPNFMWVFCASYALFMGTNVIVLKFSDIDADKHINRYLDILLNNKESKQQCEVDQSIIEQVNHNTQSIEGLLINSHEPGG